MSSLNSGLPKNQQMRVKAKVVMLFFTRMMYNPFCYTARGGLDLWGKNIHSIKIQIYRKFKLVSISLKLSFNMAFNLSTSQHFFSVDLLIVLIKKIRSFESVGIVPEFDHSNHGTVISPIVCRSCFTKWFQLWSLRINREPWQVTWKRQRRMFVRFRLLRQKVCWGNPAVYQKLSVGLYLLCDIYCKYVIIATMLLVGYILYIFAVELTFPISQHSNHKHARLGVWLSLFFLVSFFIYTVQIKDIVKCILGAAL